MPNPASVSQKPKRRFRRIPPLAGKPNQQTEDQGAKIETITPGTDPLVPGILASLLATFISYGEVTRALRILRETLEAQIYSTAPLSKSINAADTLYFTWIQSLDLAHVTKDSYQAINRALTTEVERLPKLAVYLPFISNRQDLVSIYSKAKDSIPGQFLLDVRFDKDLIAGCALVWGGKYQDFSLRSKLNQNKESITKILAGYNTGQ